MRSSGLQAKHKGEMMNKCPAGDQETVEQPSIYDPSGLHVNFLTRQAKEWREKNGENPILAKLSLLARFLDFKDTNSVTAFAANVHVQNIVYILDNLVKICQYIFDRERTSP